MTNKKLPEASHAYTDHHNPNDPQAYHKGLNSRTVEKLELLGDQADELLALPGQLNSTIQNVANQIESALSVDTAMYPPKKNIKRYNINQNKVRNLTNQFPRSVEDELLDIATGGNRNKDLIAQAATDLAEICFMPPTEDSLNFTHSDTPWVNIPQRGSRRIIPMDVRVNLINTPISLPLFKPVKTNAYGILTFRYMGDEPLHGVLKGHLEILKDCHITNPNSGVGMTLCLEPYDNTPFVEMGESSGRRYLSSSRASDSLPIKLNFKDEFNDWFTDVTTTTKSVLSGYPNLITETLNGFFNANTPTDELETSDNLGPVDEYMRSTPWFSVTSLDLANDLIAVIFNDDFITNRGRLRVKDAQGNMTYVSDQSLDRNGMRYYRIPVGSVSAQIYFSGRASGLNYSMSNIAVKRVPESLLSSRDTVAGYFQKKSFAVNREVSFMPGTEYAFSFLTQIRGAAFTHRSYKFRYLSGGFTLLFDAGSLRKKFASKLFKDF